MARARPYPDAVQSNGSVSYDQGYGVDYTLPNTNPSYKYMEQDKFNQLFYDITSALQQLPAGGTRSPPSLPVQHEWRNPILLLQVQ